jgi:hypothetical protein
LELVLFSRQKYATINTAKLGEQMSWNYRIGKKTDDLGREYFSMVEAYYRADSISYCDASLKFYESAAEVYSTLKMMLEDAQADVLDLDEIGATNG